MYIQFFVQGATVNKGLISLHNSPREWEYMGVKEVLLCFAFFCCSCLADNYYYVSPDGNGTICSLPSPCSLEQAISLAAPTENSTVNLLPGSYSITQCISIQDGNNITIQGESRETTLLIPSSTNCAFSIVSSQVTFLNLTFSHFATNAIYVDPNSQSFVSDCDFIENSSSGSTLYSEGVLAVNFSRFINNTSTAIKMGEGQIANCIFTNNSISTNGGAIYFRFHSYSTGSVSVSDCIFTLNYAIVRAGGAIYFEPVDSGSITFSIDNCIFAENNAFSAGGAIYFVSGSGSGSVSGSIDSCTFTSNFAHTGGALYFEALGSGSSINGSIDDCTFTSNIGIDNGGAIYFKASGSGSIVSGSVDDCTFITNSASSAGGAINFDATGSGSVVGGNVNNCAFISNTAFLRGGAIYLESLSSGSARGSINGCSFTENSALNAGAIYIFSGSGSASGSVDNCTFTSNSAFLSGGAIFFDSVGAGSYSSGSIDNCTFTSNSALYGGGVFLHSPGVGSAVSGSIGGSTFTTNSATEGGAIYFQSGSGSVHGSIDSCTFTSCSATRGGAIYFSSPTIGSVVDGSVDNCSFTSNSATNGGAIYFASGAGFVSGSVDDCSFTSNFASDGGAISFESVDSGDVSGSIDSCNFTSNSASGGGAISFISGSGSGSGSVYGSIDNCNFNFNFAFAGGAIYFELLGNGIGSVSGSIDNCNFTSNSASDSDGGAIYFESLGSGSVSGSIDFCSFTSNNASGDGGGIHFQSLGSGSVNGSIDSCDFNSNSALGGGAICFFSNTGGAVDGRVDNCTFTSNSATGGGAIYFDSVDSGSIISGSIADCHFTSNFATGGGAIYFNSLSSGSVGGSIDDCTFISNSASDGGGAIYFGLLSIDSGSISGGIVNCSFTSNFAYDGGAIYFQSLGSSIGSVDNCHFISNYASDSGGALYSNSSGGSVSDCSFTLNSAASGGALYSDSGEGHHNFNLSDCSFTSNSAEYGGGAHLINSAINYCTFNNNTASFGGGLLMENSLALDLIITSNYASLGSGGYITNSTVTNSTIQSNVGFVAGGGFYSENGMITNCTFQNNSLQSSVSNSYVVGGAIYCTGQNCSLDNVILSKNSLSNTGGCYGGAIFLSSSSVELRDSQIDSNIISQCDFSYGGGVFISKLVQSCNFDNVLLEQNQIVCSVDSPPFESLGGGIFSQNFEANLTSVILTNNTISCSENQNTSSIYISTYSGILVSASGSNNSACGLPYFPCNIYHTVAVSNGNENLILSPGNNILTLPLEITTNLTIAGVENQQCILSYNPEFDSEVAMISAVDDITFNSVIFQGSDVFINSPLLTNSPYKKMMINNCTFNNIDSYSPSLITNGYVVMENNTFINNNYICKSDNCSGLLLALGGARISNCKFTNNILRGQDLNSTICQGAAMKAISGDLFIENSEFQSNVIYNCSTMLGSAFSIEDFTEVVINSSSFRNNSIIIESASCNDVKGGGIYLSSTGGNSSIYLSNVDLQYNSIVDSSNSSCKNGELFGGGLHGEFLGGNNFFSIDALNASNNTISAGNSIGTKVNGGAVSIKGNTDLEIVSSYFFNNTIVSGSITETGIEGFNARGGALYTGCSSSINNSIFADNIAFGSNVTGGAIYSETFLSINSSSIANNQVNAAFGEKKGSGLGGGIFTNQIANLNNVTFANNSCHSNDSNSLGQAGGGLYLGQSHSTTSLNDCYFIDNFANEGAAMYIEKVYEMPSMNQVSAINNTAVISGGALFIYEWFVNNSKSCVELFSGGLDGNIARGNESNCNSMPSFLANPNAEISDVYVSPGSFFHFEVGLFDYFNKISYFENYYVLIAASANDLITGSQRPFIAPDEDGIYKFDNLAIIATINSNISLEFTSFSTKQGSPKYQLTIQAFSVYCYPNEVAYQLNDNQTTCISCESNQFAFGEGACELCPEEESCISHPDPEDFSEFEILEGFWPNSFENPTELIQCPFEESCESIRCQVEWNVERWNWDTLCDNCADGSCNICSEGYTNYLCSECICNEDECWYATGEECKECDTSVINNFLEGAGVLLIVIITILILPKKGVFKILFELCLVIIMELLGFVEWIEVGFALLILVTVLISKEEIPSGIAQGFLFYVQIITSTIPDETWTEKMQSFMEHLESLNFRIYGLPCISSALASPISQYLVLFLVPFFVGAIICLVNTSKRLLDAFFLDKFYKTTCSKKSSSRSEVYHPLSHFEENHHEESPSEDEHNQIEIQESSSESGDSHPENPSEHHSLSHFKGHIIDNLINTSFVTLSLAYFSICTLTFDIFACDNGYLVSYPYYPCDFSTNYLYLVIIGSLLGFTFIVGYPLIVLVVLLINKRKIKAKDHSIEHRLEFLVENYRSEIFYFEFVWLMIKLVLAIAKTLFESHLAVQQFLITAIISSTLLMFFFTKPYSSRAGNTVIVITLVALLFTYTTSFIEHSDSFSFFISLFTGFFVVGYVIIIILGLGVVKLIKKKISRTPAAVIVENDL